METEFYFVRHGITGRNDKGLLPDGKDEPLSEEGKQQILEVTCPNIPKDIQLIFRSPLIRCHETANIIFFNVSDDDIFEAYELADDRISEVNFGQFGGKTWQEVNHLSGENQKLLYSKQEYDFSSHGGDSFESVKKRVYDFIEEKKKKFRGKKIVVVTHAGVIRCVYKTERNEVFLEKAPENGSVHKFIF